MRQLFARRLADWLAGALICLSPSFCSFSFLLLQVSNAIKFSPHGRELRVLLEFSGLQLDAALLSLGARDGGRVPSDADVAALAGRSLGQVLVRVTVKDEGAGVPAEHQANLFRVSLPRESARWLTIGSACVRSA